MCSPPRVLFTVRAVVPRGCTCPWGSRGGAPRLCGSTTQDAVKDEKGLWSHQDAEFVTVGFGSDVDLTVTDLDLTLKTDGFPRD